MSAGFRSAAVRAVLEEVMEERRRQHEKWGEQNLPDFHLKDPRAGVMVERLATARGAINAHIHDGDLTYEAILYEEVHEALVERDPAKVRAELVQVAAVCVQWIEKLDREASR